MLCACGVPLVKLTAQLLRCAAIERRAGGTQCRKVCDLEVEAPGVCGCRLRVLSAQCARQDSPCTWCVVDRVQLREMEAQAVVLNTVMVQHEEEVKRAHYKV